MDELLRQIWEQIRTRLYGPWTAENRDDEYHACIMHGLHDCRQVIADHFGIQPEALTHFVRPDPTVRLPHTGREYLVDFSWTTYPLWRWFDQGISHPEGIPYRMLLGCESESGSWLRVLEDFVKLLDLRCPVKVLAYRGGVGRPDHLVAVQQYCQSLLQQRPDFNASDGWLFVGVPEYVDGHWPTSVAESGVQVHVVAEQNGLPGLVQPTWFPAAGG